TVISSCDSPPVLESIKCSLNEISHFVGIFFIQALHNTVPFWRNNGYCLHTVLNIINNTIGVITFVCEYSLCCLPLQQRLSLGAVSRVSRCQLKLDRLACPVCDKMQLCG